MRASVKNSSWNESAGPGFCNGIVPDVCCCDE